MSSLFQLPNAVSLPGAKLTFSVTGTSTLQNTYQDINLSVAHPNPVVADANGIFAPIYLDPSLPNYRVKHTTSADVLIRQVDGVPSNQAGGQFLRLSATDTYIILEDTDAASNEKKYRIRAANGDLSIELLSDDEGTITTALKVLRTGTNADQVRFVSDRVTVAPVSETDTVDGPIVRRKTSDTSTANDNSVNIDPNLQYTFPSSPGAFYMFDAHLEWTCTSTTPGTLFQIGASGGTCKYSVTGSSNAATASPVDPINFGTSSGTSLGWAWTNTASHIASIQGRIAAPNAGDVLALYWSQTVSNATAMVLKAGSYLRIWRVS